MPVFNQANEAIGEAGSLSAGPRSSNRHLDAIDDENAQAFDVTEAANPGPPRRSC